MEKDHFQSRIEQSFDSQMVNSVLKTMEVDDRGFYEIFFHIVFQILSVEEDVADVEADGKAKLIDKLLHIFKRVSQGLNGNSVWFDGIFQYLFNTSDDSSPPCFNIGMVLPIFISQVEMKCIKRGVEAEGSFDYLFYN